MGNFQICKVIKVLTTSSDMNFGEVMNYFLVWILVKWQTSRQTDIQTESDAYEPTVHMHRCAKKINRLAVYI